MMNMYFIPFSCIKTKQEVSGVDGIPYVGHVGEVKFLEGWDISLGLPDGRHLKLKSRGFPGGDGKPFN